MNHKPIIGVVSAKHETRLLPMYRTSAHYIEAVHAAGGIPIQLDLMPGAAEEELRALVSICDGFLLPGGGDFDPDWYRQTLLPNLSPDNSAIDRGSQATAIALIRLMAASGKPMLGICLGMQAINVALGGDLYQDIPTQRPSEIRHGNDANVLSDRWQIAHRVTLAPGSLVNRVSGGNEIAVNSFHHQAVWNLAPGFKATAWAPDDLVEAMESDSGRILGVQWHPENLAHAGDDSARALFRWLIDEASK